MSKVFDQFLYVAIGSLSAAMAWQGPLDWRGGCAILLAGLVALKAKRSNGTPEPLWHGETIPIVEPPKPEEGG